jgi:hypothetical protein
MQRRLVLLLAGITFLAVSLNPILVCAQPAQVPAQAGPKAGVFPVVRQAGGPGPAVAAPATTEAHAPAPRSDVAADEYRQWKQQAAHRRNTGGKEVHYDSTPSPLAPGTGNNFNGLGQNGWIPYDAAIAIGPNHVLEMTNSQWAVYSRSGSQLSINQFANWWGTQAGTPFDPKCFYDPAANRFLMIAVSVSSTQAFYHISVTQTGDPTGAWFNYQLNARLDGTTNTNNWADFPQLGQDDNAVYISSNQFTLVSNFFQYSKIRVLKKAELYAGGAITYTDFTGMRNADNSLAFTLQPAQTLSSSAVGYFLNSRSSSGSNVTLWRMDNPTTSPALVRQATVSVGSYVLPPDAAQPNTGTLVATNDARMLELAFRNGVLHGVFTEAVGGVAAMRYLRINASTNALLKDISYTAPGIHYFFPAVSVDSADNVYFVMSRSSASEFASLYHTGMQPADAAIQPSALLKAGVSTNTTGRWGDYSGIAIDPADPFAVWAAGGWANTSNRWATWNAQSTFGSSGTGPTLASINPSSGSPGQVLNNVQLLGTNFDTSAVINISGMGVSPSNTQLISPTELRATFTVAGNAGAGGRSVTVTTTNGTSNAQTFTVSSVGPPTLSSASPAVLNPGQTYAMTVIGTNFVAGGTSLTFTGGTGVSASNLNVTGPTQLTVDFLVASNASLGGHFFNVTTSGGTSNAIHFDVLLPSSITSITPNNGNPGTAVNITLSGARFYNNSNIQVSGGGVSVSNIARPGPTTMTATFTIAPGALAGPRDVTVVNLAGTSNAVVFTVNGQAQPPTLTSIVPDNGDQGASVPVTLTGTDFLPGSSVNVSGAGMLVANVMVVSSTEITATFMIDLNAVATSRNVTVSTSAGVSNALPFTVNPGPSPVLNSVTPNGGSQADSVSVTLLGANFLPGFTTVDAGGVFVTSFTVVSSTQIDAVFDIPPALPPGNYNVTVTTPAATSNALPFNVTLLAPPTISSLLPNSGAAGSTLTVSIFGTGFLPFSGPTVNINAADVSVTSWSVVSRTQVDATLVIGGNAVAGPRDVTVTTSGGTSNPVPFNVVGAPPPPPVLNTIGPSSGLIGDTLFNAVLTGANFDSSSMVNFSGAGVAASNTRLVDGTQLLTDIVIDGHAAAGPRSVTVTTGNGTSNSVTFTVNLPPPPALSSISPGVMNPGKTVTALISGANFVNGATSITLTTGTGVTATNIQTNLIGVPPGVMSADFVIAMNASLGGHRFRVTTPAGTSNEIFFDVLRAPVINSLTPNAAAPGSSVSVTISGANYYNGATLQISGAGVTLSNIVRVSITTITATFTVAPGALPGPRDVTVVTLAGTSNAVPFTVQ